MAALTRRVPTIQETLWAHPQWWIVAIGVLAWVPVVPHGIASSVHAHSSRASFGTELLFWHVMVLAMMVPAMAWKARGIALRSLAERRHRAMSAFLAGHLVPWSALGMAAAWIRDLAWSDSHAAVAGSFVVATVWTLLPLRERARAMAHGYTPVIGPRGWDADRDCTLAGLTVGAWCVASCGPLMLACALSGHHLAAMGAGWAIGVAEIRSFRPPTRFVVLVSVALTVFFVAS